MKLNELRHKKGFSQNDLAVASGVKLRTIQCYENESRNINTARLETLCDFALALDCKVIDLLTDETLIKKIKVLDKR